MLEWMGKQKVVNHHNDVPFHVLERQYSFDAKGKHEEDNGSENMIIHGDNLVALKSLLPRYEGQIKCIYIDPPYNTGNEGWVYNDNVNDPQIKKWLGEVVGKEGEDFSRHDKWLCMMYPRLKLLQKLLAKDGAIFISIDDNELYNLKLICDEIFGGCNFIADVAVVNNFKGRSDDKYIATAHEHLLIYQKGAFVSNGVVIPEEYDKEYKLVDEGGRYRLQGLRKRGDSARREDRPNMYYPFFCDPKTGRVALEEFDDCIEVLPKLSDGSDGRWRWGKETAAERIKELVAQKVKGRGEFDVFQKDYLPNDGKKRIKPKSIWMGSEFSKETGTLEVKAILGKGKFETPKPLGLLSYILEQATDKDSIVLDSFAGSGTMAHAVINANAKDGGTRRFVLVEMMDYAEGVTAERVKRVGGDFSFYELGPQLMIDGVLNEEVPTEKIREYVWYTETKQPIGAAEKGDAYKLGEAFGVAYYFCYEKNKSMTLNRALLKKIKTKAESYVVYADACTLSPEELEKMHITFKKIPRDVARF